MSFVWNSELCKGFWVTQLAFKNCHTVSNIVLCCNKNGRETYIEPIDGFSGNNILLVLIYNKILI